jgi:hypothetical protein
MDPGHDGRIRHVRHLVRTEVGLIVVFAAGLLVSYTGLAVFVSGRDRFMGGVVLVLGLWVTLAAPVVHDRLHRERGEESHALWGRADRWKPTWWRTR